MSALPRFLPTVAEQRARACGVPLTLDRVVAAVRFLGSPDARALDNILEAYPAHAVAMGLRECVRRGVVRKQQRGRGASRVVVYAC